MRNEAERVFDALGEPMRRRIVELLASGPHAVGELAHELPLGRPAVSKHLKVLTNAGLTEYRSHGTSNLYSLRPDGLKAARRWLTEMWDVVLAAYAGAAQEQSRRRRQAQPDSKETPSERHTANPQRGLNRTRRRGGV